MNTRRKHPQTAVPATTKIAEPINLHPFAPQTVLKILSTDPGVYILYNNRHGVLYVGKARNLKKRVGSYFRRQLNQRINTLIHQVHAIKTILTQTENEALLLESNLIKQLKPRYNILLRDNKSYPYIVLSKHPVYPRLSFYRGLRQDENHYFGPYSNPTAVKQALNLLHTLFHLRSCQDHFFRNRTRPCLQYQIKRCTAPCVGLISPEHYQQDVRRARLFLQGKEQTLIEELISQMETASNSLDYERAARYRDQITHLRQIQQPQVVSTEKGELDIIGLATNQAQYCIYVMNVRGGRLLGGRPYFPQVPVIMQEAELITEFLSQLYLQCTAGENIPAQIIVAQKIATKTWLGQALSERATTKVTITRQRCREHGRWLALAQQNAQQALVVRLAERSNSLQRLQALQAWLKLSHLPRRLECFDVSHTQGASTLAACVVFDIEGPRKQDYRRFSITQIGAGDDYAAIRQALTRHYTRLKSNIDSLPDVLIIDGGQGQLTQAEQVLTELQLHSISVLSIAKGPGRKPGCETLFVSGVKSPIVLTPNSIVLHFLQHIRDEAHRFAISGHRQKRRSKTLHSILLTLPGIGIKRKHSLLKHFGGLRELLQASTDEIAAVSGIGSALAKRIYSALKDSN